MEMLKNSVSTISEVKDFIEELKETYIEIDVHNGEEVETKLYAACKITELAEGKYLFEDDEELEESIIIDLKEYDFVEMVWGAVLLHKDDIITVVSLA